MAACLKTRNFFETATPEQFEWVLKLYDQCLRIKAEAKSSKPENLIRLDKWYQNELPKKIKGRGKDPHLVHEDLVQTIKWKLARGKFRPSLTNLVQMNTPRVVMQETKKAFRNIYKKDDLNAALTALCNLKGVGPAMASAVLAAGAPHIAPFMADECLWAMPDIECLDYTMKEYMRYATAVKEQVDRLRGQGAGEEMNPHRVELAVWTFYVANDLKPELLEDMPSASAPKATPSVEATNGTDEVKPEAKAEEAKVEETATNGAEAAESSSSNGKVEESSTNGESNGNGAEAEKAAETEVTNGNGESAATDKPTENGSSSQETKSETASETPAEAEKVEEVAKAPAVSAVMDQSEENTNDSTKENVEAVAAVKRPANGENGEAKDEVEPAAKKIKSSEESPEANGASDNANPAPTAQPLTSA